MFEIKDVSKKYGNEFALSHVSMEIGKGLNFIIGSSGSGKTTMLKIISGMEQEFDGEVFYCGQSLKTLTGQEKSYYYNHVFGFVWQDFNLLDELTVLENVMLPQYLKPNQDEKAVMKILRELKISEFAHKKAGSLSGGQKQRVAIARELLKNPQVILADEPTSALDEQSAKATMDILRLIAKSRTVIVVTHDTSLIDLKSNVYELDKGELLTPAKLPPAKNSTPPPQQPHGLSFRGACKLAAQNAKRKAGRFSATAISMLVAATLLLVTVSGAISGSNQSAFDTLFATYGQSILDVNVVASFMSAGGTDGAKSDEPNADVSQNIDGLYEKYLHDERIAHIVSLQAYQNIRITEGGKTYMVENSGSVPSLYELTAGTMPMGAGGEVVVPQSFAKKLGLTDEEILGRTIDFDAEIYNWSTGEPVLFPVKVTAKIVGVANTITKYDSEGKIMEYTVDDSFFFSKPALDEMRAQAKIENEEGNFSIRAKTPADMIAVKDELNAAGIVPLGRFELVEDMVRLNEQTSRQSGSAVIVIGILAVVAALAVALMTALTRRREYAIYRVSGYGAGHLALIAVAEFLLAAAVTAFVFICTSPLINLATTAIWSVNILNGRLLAVGMLLVLAVGALSGAVSVLIGVTARASASLKTGDR